ncbi:MAG: hypothetical protein LBV41_00435 [Cytophagaceae bacterium]|nr:hypothetical protein [Cytophagaceae bacterium]
MKFKEILRNDKQGVSKLIHSVECHLKKLHANKSKEKKIMVQLEYFKNYKNCMNYAVCIENELAVSADLQFLPHEARKLRL